MRKINLYSICEGVNFIIYYYYLLLISRTTGRAICDSLDYSRAIGRANLRFSGLLSNTPGEKQAAKKKPVPVENLIAPCSPPSIGSKIPASKTG